VKIYSIVMMALQNTGARMTLVDYVPCWRTAAGTGEGMGFMFGRPQSQLMPAISRNNPMSTA
jgi:hypothetical protein